MIGRIWSILDRTQQSRLFKMIASGVVVAIAIASLIVYSVAAAKGREATNAIFAGIDSQARQFEASQAGTPESPEVETSSRATPMAQASSSSGGDSPRGADDEIDATRQVFKSIVQAQYNVRSIAIGIGILTLLALVIIWVNLALTYLAIALVCSLILVGASLAGALKTIAPFVIGLATLTGAFTAIMRLLMALLAWPTPVVSIARNVLQEAVRMKVSLIFIITMIFGLAVLPMLLSAEQPLRYRIQAFLQYGTSGAFALISILVVLFSVMTVAGEQRDKQIWQTITKPVAPWQYILGKWLGVGTLSAALLAVSASGIFVFTEYLRNQPAQGETTAFTSSIEATLSEDRFMVETQVLTSRKTIGPDAPEWNMQELAKEVNARVEQEMANLEIIGDTPEQLMRNKDQARQLIQDDLLKSLSIGHRTILPGDNRVYVFSGLEEARKSNRPIIFRYRIQSGQNSPDAQYKISIEFPAVAQATVQDVPLDQIKIARFMPTIVNDNGMVIMRIFNGDVYQDLANPMPITFPTDGLRLSYATSSYQANYFRLMFVLWIKLLFLAMVGICAATFLSFPVAALFAFVIFWAAEGAGTLTKALEVYRTEDLEGKSIWFNTIVAKLAEGIAWVFRVYADLRPTARLVEGEYLSWSSLMGGSTIVLIWCAVLFGAGVLIFRRRELALYSGH